MRIKWKFWRWLRTSLGIRDYVSGSRPSDPGERSAVDAAAASLHHVSNPINGSPAIGLEVDRIFEQLGMVVTHPIRTGDIDIAVLGIRNLQHRAAEATRLHEEQSEMAVFVRHFFAHDINAPATAHLHTGTAFDAIRYYLMEWEPSEHRQRRESK
jgi:hypothetical protein